MPMLVPARYLNVEVRAVSRRDTTFAVKRRCCADRHMRVRMWIVAADAVDRLGHESNANAEIRAMSGCPRARAEGQTSKGTLVTLANLGRWGRMRCHDDVSEIGIGPDGLSQAARAHTQSVVEQPRSVVDVNVPDLRGREPGHHEGDREGITELTTSPPSINGNTRPRGLFCTSITTYPGPLGTSVLTKTAEISKKSVANHSPVRQFRSIRGHVSGTLPDGDMNSDWSFAEGSRDVRQTQAELARLERREWWSWSAALLIIIVLAAAVATLALASVNEEVLTTPQRDLVLRGLVPLVLIFALFSIRQQLLIRRLRRQFALHMGLMATMEVLRRPTQDQRQGWQNRRQNLRFYFDQRVKVHLGKQTFHGRTRDISEGGIGIVVPDPIPLGSRVLLEFATGERGRSISAEGILRHHRGFYNGIEFVELSAESLESIRGVCAGDTVPDLREATT